MSNRKDSKLVALENEKRILRALSRFGWLRTKDIATLCWSKWQDSPKGEVYIRREIASASSVRMAQITLKRMFSYRLVLKAIAQDGAVIYALAERGARFLRDIGVKASTGKDVIRTFSLSQYRHRAISNQIAINALVDGFKVSTEREIAQGKWIGGFNGFMSKKPDVLIRNDKKIFWVEVERSRKNTKDLTNLISWINNVSFDNRIENYEIISLIFICRPALKTLISREISRKNIKLNIRFVCDIYDFEEIIFR